MNANEYLKYNRYMLLEKLQFASEIIGFVNHAHTHFPFFFHFISFRCCYFLHTVIYYSVGCLMCRLAEAISINKSIFKPGKFHSYRMAVVKKKMKLNAIESNSSKSETKIAHNLCHEPLKQE